LTSGSEARYVAPVVVICVALARPINRGRKKALQDSRVSPRRAKGKASFAPDQATRMAAAKVMVNPNPAAGPLMATIVGFVQLAIARATFPPLISVR
jgi:hypothetical protein